MTRRRAEVDLPMRHSSKSLCSCKNPSLACLIVLLHILTKLEDCTYLVSELQPSLHSSFTSLLSALITQRLLAHKTSGRSFNAESGGIGNSNIEPPWVECLPSSITSPLKEVEGIEQICKSFVAIRSGLVELIRAGQPY
jgi:hypothetical protein